MKPPLNREAVMHEGVIEVLPADDANRALLANAHPADWVNPEPAPGYNLVVIGAGTAGLVSAAGAAGLGAKVALVERQLLGGDCLNVGCVPSKAVLRAARAAAEVRRAGEFGVYVAGDVTVDFGALMARMRRLRADLSGHDSAARFRGLGVDVFLGDARFTSPDTIEVAGKTLRFRRAILATGARAARPDIPGLAQAGYLTNENVFNLTELPRRLAVLGAGPIGCELAQAFARFGSEVHLLGKHPNLLPREDVDAAAVVERAFVHDGVRFRGGFTLERVEKSASETVLYGRGAEPVRVDAVLVGVGRTPNVEGMGLEAAGVVYTEHGVAVDDRLRTTNRRVFAAGDVCSRYQFTHAADATARVAIQNALFPFGRAKASALTIPWCTYTDPEIAHVGLYPHEAEEQGIALDTFTQEMGRVDRAVLDGDTDGFVKVHVKKGTDRILGATIVARHAGEMISEVTLAMVGKLGLKTLSRTIHPYPTQAEALRKAGDAYNRTRLTPFVKGLFERWFRWTR
jgi:pyruvate/2-oxoglutarate dehydrogenase complex dihydrolipoamide dehydrogenase (E3) component